MKRLFCVKNGNSSVVDNPETGNPWFDNKQKAKKFRDTLSEKPPYTISRGPDHMGKHGHKVVRMRLQPKRVK